MTFEITKESKDILVDALELYMASRANYALELEEYLREEYKENGNRSTTNKKRINNAIKTNRATHDKAERLWCELSKLRES